jgi:hypothetical protein
MTLQRNVDAVTDAPDSLSVRDVVWRLAPMIYGPTVLFALGEGAIIPLLPIYATRLGAGVAMAALIGAALVVGQVCGNIPAGWAVARFGERITMACAGGFGLVGLAGMLLAPRNLSRRVRPVGVRRRGAFRRLVAG